MIELSVEATKPKALIDGDSLIFAVCSATENVLDWGEGNEYYPNPEINDDFDKSLDTLLKGSGLQKFELYLSGRENFRYDNPLGYKQNRKDTRRPLGIDELKRHAVKKHGACIVEGVEADDVCVYLKRKNPEGYVLVAIDKDVLMQCAGTHYNYHRLTLNYVSVSALTARAYKYYQTLVGDITDGYKGCPSIGAKRALAILQDTDGTHSGLWTAVLQTFLSKGLTKDDAVNTMRLADMTQWNGSEVVLFDPEIDASEIL